MAVKSKHNLKNYLFLLVASMAVLVYVDYTSVISYLYTLVLFFAFHYVIKDWEELDRNFYIFHFYLAIAVLLTVIFKHQIPEYLGMTGPEGGIGTDDCRFYAMIVGGDAVWYHLTVDVSRMHHFAKLLRYIYPLEVHTPLNVVVVNILGACFLPYYMKKLCFEMFHDKRLAERTALLTLLCPYCAYYGSILMRELFMATCVIAGIYYFMRKHWIGLAICVLIISYIRFGTIVYLGVGCMLVIRRNMILAGKSTVRFSLLILFSVIVFFFLYEHIQAMSGGKLGDSLIRSTNSAYFSGTTFAKLLALPFPINIMLSTLFFFIVPIFGLPIVRQDILLMSSVFQSFLTGLFFFVMWGYIANCILSYLSNRHKPQLQLAVLFTIVFTMLLGTVDLQIRHKTVVFPFMCMLAAYGMVKYDKHQKYISFFLGVFMILVQLALFAKGEM